MKKWINKFAAMFFTQDKLLHLICGLVIAFLFGLITPLLGLCVGIIAGLVKEAWDEYNVRGSGEAWDFIFTVIGAVTGYIFVLL